MVWLLLAVLLLLVFPALETALEGSVAAVAPVLALRHAVIAYGFARIGVSAAVALAFVCGLWLLNDRIRSKSWPSVPAMVWFGAISAVWLALARP